MFFRSFYFRCFCCWKRRTTAIWWLLILLSAIQAQNWAVLNIWMKTIILIARFNQMRIAHIWARKQWMTHTCAQEASLQNDTLTLTHRDTVLMLSDYHKETQMKGNHRKTTSHIWRIKTLQEFANSSVTVSFHNERENYMRNFRFDVIINIFTPTIHSEKGTQKNQQPRFVFDHIMRMENNEYD